MTVRKAFVVAVSLWTAFVLIPTGLAEQQASACDDLNTVCATSVAEARVDCVRVDLITIQCTGSARVGGGGGSPAGLPGSVAWTGSAACTDACAEPTSGELVGAAAWPGLGANEGSSEGLIVLGTVTKTLLGCITMTVTATADAAAQTGLDVPAVGGVLLTKVAAPQAVESVTGMICLP